MSIIIILAIIVAFVAGFLLGCTSAGNILEQQCKKISSIEFGKKYRSVNAENEMTGTAKGIAHYMNGKSQVLLEDIQIDPKGERDHELQSFWFDVNMLLPVS